MLALLSLTLASSKRHKENELNGLCCLYESFFFFCMQLPDDATFTARLASAAFLCATLFKSATGMFNNSVFFRPYLSHLFTVCTREPISVGSYMSTRRTLPGPVALFGPDLRPNRVFHRF